MYCTIVWVYNIPLCTELSSEYIISSHVLHYRLSIISPHELYLSLNILNPTMYCTIVWVYDILPCTVLSSEYMISHHVLYYLLTFVLCDMMVWVYDIPPCTVLSSDLCTVWRDRLSICWGRCRGWRRHRPPQCRCRSGGPRDRKLTKLFTIE